MSRLLIAFIDDQAHDDEIYQMLARVHREADMPDEASEFPPAPNSPGN
jgi:hypothetical protein